MLFAPLFFNNRSPFILLFAFIFCCAYNYAQPTVLGTELVDGSYQTYDLNDLGSFRQYRLQAMTSATTGTRIWEFCQGTAVFPDYITNWRPYSSGLILAGYDQTIPPVSGTASALFNTGSGGSSGLLPAITANNYYTFNVTEYSTPGSPQNEYMSVLETDYDPATILSVMQSPAATSVYDNNSVIVTAEISSSLNPEEYLYLRYSSTSSFTTSTLVEFNMTGTTGTAVIPCFSAGITIYYYVYSSNRTQAEIETDVTSNGQVAHDMSTLNLNNDGGINYQYTVLTGASYCGVYYVPSDCYPTMASFVNGLNTGTVTCAVTCYVSAGYTETAPAGGIHLTQTGTSANTITFQKYGAGENPVINAYIGTVSLTVISTSADGIFSLNGSDYVTLDGIDLFDANSVAPKTMEYGYGLFKQSASNGCQNNTIKNCSITLKSTNTSLGPSQFEDGSRGVFAGNITRTAINSSLTVTTAQGRNDNNTFISNTIKNIHHGIVVKGFQDLTSPFTYYDQSNIIGQADAGNIIEKYGGSGTNPVYGIYVIYNNNCSIAYNTIDNTASGGTPHTSTLYGIFHSGGASSTIDNLSITNNYLKLVQGSNTNSLICLKAGYTGSAGTVTISDNTIENCSFTAGASGVFYGIDQDLDASSVTINNNIISNNTLNTSASLASFLIDNSNSTVNTTFSNNQLTNNHKTVTSSGALYGYYNNVGSATGGSELVTDNLIDGLTVASGSSAQVVGIRVTTAPAQIKSITNNNVTNVTGGTGTIITSSGITADGMAAGSSVSNNSVSNISSAANVVGINCGSTTIGTSSNTAFGVSGNNVSNISSTGGTSTTAGIIIYATSSATSVTCDSNTIDNISVSGTGTINLRGISIGGGTTSANYTINQCTISNVNHTGATGSPVVSGIYSTTSSTTSISRNDIHNISGSSGGTFTVSGIHIFSGTATHTISNNFIQKITAPYCTNTIGVIGINLIPTFSTYNLYYNIIALGEDIPLSGGSNFGCSGVIYPNSGTSLLNLKNNIVYVNANPNLSGTAACVRRISGVAGTAPPTSNFSSSSNRNFYYINTGNYNYVYVDGTTSSTIVNGYSFGSSFTDAAKNLNNDPCFNEIGTDNTSYKYFMSPRESESFFDIPPFIGGSTLPLNLKLSTDSLNYAESHAENITAITTDWEGDIRQGNPGYTGTGTAPDIGADEGEFVYVEVPSCYLLPIELVNFEGWYNGSVNELHWTTLSEINSDKFEVQKSIDGLNFYTIGNVHAQGFSYDATNYIFYDDNPVPGINYYRLKMIDIDKSYEFSNTIAINIPGTSATVIQLYPNPANDVLNVSMHTSSASNILIAISDVFGKTLMINSFTNVSIADNLQLNISQLPAAAYFITITNTYTGEATKLKFIKIG